MNLRRPIDSLPTVPDSRWVKLLTVVVALIALYLLIGLFSDTETYQWDFRTYYYAAKAHSLGADPYDADAVWRLGRGPYKLRYVYPPLTLSFFKLWAVFPYDTACKLWLVFKLLLAGMLLYIWKARLFRDADIWHYLLFASLSFSFTIYIDLLTGNVSILEQFLLWLGVAALLQGRTLQFVIAVVLASLFKLTPIVFLILPLLLRQKRAPILVGGGLAGFVALMVAGYLYDPSASGAFLAAAGRIEETAALGNPSLYSLFTDLGRGAAAYWGSLPGEWLGNLLYVILVIVFMSASWRRVKKAAIDGDGRLEVILLVCATYAISVPRFKTYAFILMLPPAFYALRRSARLPAYFFLAALLMLTVHPPLPVPIPFRAVLSGFWLYYPLFLSMLVWGLLLRQVRASA